MHQFINHQIEYVNGNVHTNTMKRGLNGTYVSVDPFHLSAYVDEQCFRFNHRKSTGGERFLFALAKAPTARLTYSDLIRTSAE